MKKLKDKKEYLIAPLVVLGVVLFVFLLKGIFPFGHKTIAMGDLGQSYMTFYHFLWDVLRGNKSLFFDYGLGLGSNTYGGFVVDGFLNPINWIVALGTRNSVPYTLSFILMIKLMIIAVTSYALFKTINKKNPYYNHIFSILYALSGYTLCYFSNLMWLDVVALFPLFVLATKHMLTQNKVGWFAIILALILICNYNLAYMVLLFIIILVPIYIHYGMEKEDRKKAVYNLIIGVLLSIGLSAFAFIPALVQTMTSYRMSGAVTNAVTNGNVLHKMGMLLFASLPITIYLLGMNDKNKNKKMWKMANIALILSFVIPVLVERVNLWWHSGSYQCFPFRYGFIPILIIMMICLQYINNIKEENKKKKEDSKRIIVVSILLVILAGVSVATAIQINHNNPVFNYANFYGFVGMFIGLLLGVFADVNTCKISQKKTRYILFTITSMIFVISYSYAYLGLAGENLDIEHSDQPVFYAERLSEVLQSDLYRVKDLSNYQFENNPVVSNLPSKLSFLHIISKEQVFNTKQLGYSHLITKQQDGGGTLFTDQILGMQYVISNEELPERLYELKTTWEDKYIYQLKNTMSYGILSKDNIEDIPEEYQIMDANNYLYQTLFQKEGNIIEIENVPLNKEDTIIHESVWVEGEKELYVYIPFTNNESALMVEISVNGEVKTIPLMNNQQNTVYPGEGINGILDLGYFKDEEVQIQFEILKDTDVEENRMIQLGQLDLEKYDEIATIHHDMKVTIEKNHIHITGKSNEKTNMVLPIIYNKGFSGNVPVKRVYNTWIEIPIQEGENDITLTFIPPYWKESVIATILTIALMLISIPIRKVWDIRNSKIIMFIFWLLGFIIYSAIMIKFYLISFWQTFISFF